MKLSRDLHLTARIDSTHMYQNHVDKLTSDIEHFCDQYSQYKIEILLPTLKAVPSLRGYLMKNQPKFFRFKISDENTKSELVIDISNGISLNLRDGTYELYSLTNILKDTLNAVRVPSGVSYLRRYWLFNLLGSIEFIPALLMFAAGNWGGAIAWLILAPLGGVMLAAALFSLNEEYWGNLEWDDVILSTKIRYGHYRTRASSTFIATISSTKVVISVLASLATIASFIFVLVNR